MEGEVPLHKRCRIYLRHPSCHEQLGSEGASIARRGEAEAEDLSSRDERGGERRRFETTLFRTPLCAGLLVKLGNPSW